MSSVSDIAFKRLCGEDYSLLMSFYVSGIERLADKRFFMNYTEVELREVLSTGYVLGAFDGEKLVGVCAFDVDKAFGDKLARICGDGSGAQYYEFSGIMTDENYRGLGISNALCTRVVDFAKLNYSPCVLCATVQHDNYPSLKNLDKLGFKLTAQAPYKEYNFKYMTLKI